MIAAPTSFRETLGLFLRYRPADGLDALFAGVDWCAASPRQLSHAFLGRPPEKPGPPMAGPGAEARRLFESDEFRHDLLRRVIAAMPARQRILFVHIPKCAGSDFEAAMRVGHPDLHPSLDWVGAFGPDELARRLQAFMRHAQKTKTLFVGGHVPLPWYIDQDVYRYTDRLITILRHPHDIAVSFANFVLLCMSRDPDFRTHDVRHWGGLAGIDHFDPAWPADRIKDLARHFVTTDGLMPVNPICALLGDGTADSALRNLGRVDIEITDVTRYTAWLREAWGIERSHRANAAPQIVSAADLSPVQKARIEAACAEDMKLYPAIMAALDASGALSIMGPDLAPG